MRLALWAWLLLSALSAAAQTNSPLEQIPPLRPPHAPIPPGFWEQYGLAVLFGVLALLCLLVTVVLLLLRSRPPVLTPPAEQARQDLAPLSRQPEDGKVLSRVSQIMRRYLAAAFGLPAGELTTAEFCRALQDQARVGPVLSGSVTEFLRRCDERKFAPSPPAAPLGAVEQAVQLLEQAEARRRELAAAAAPGATPAQ